LKGTAKAKTSMNPARTIIEATYMTHSENIRIVSVCLHWW